MTELSAMAQDEATQVAKKRKLDEKEAREVIREKKKIGHSNSQRTKFKKKRRKTAFKT